MTRSVGRSVRNGLNFTERGFGFRGAVGCSDRGHTAARRSSSRGISTGMASSAGDGARWFRTGGIFARSRRPHPPAGGAGSHASGAGRARHHRLLRPQLPGLFGKAVGGQEAGAGGEPADLAPLVDVMIGNERRLLAPLSGSRSPGSNENITNIETAGFQRMIEEAVSQELPFPWWRPRCARPPRRPATTGARCATAGGAFIPGAEPAGPRDLRPRRRRRRLCLAA